MPPRVILKFVRHGETEENRKKIIQGQLDAKLNTLGKQQATLVGKALEQVPFTHAFSSDLSRAQETAQAILGSHDVALVTQVTLREKSFGDAEGLPWGTKVKNQGETPGQFRKRTVGWWNENIPSLLEESRADNKTLHVLVVGHGAFLRTLLDVVTNDTRFRITPLPDGRNLWSIPNTGISTIEILDDGDGRLVTYADVAHLEPLKNMSDANDDSLVKDNVDDLAVAA